MFCKILTWLVTILLQDIVAPYGNTCIKNMVIFFSYGMIGLQAGLRFMSHLQTFQKLNIHKGIKEHMHFFQINICWIYFTTVGR